MHFRERTDQECLKMRLNSSATAVMTVLAQDGHSVSAVYKGTEINEK